MRQQPPEIVLRFNLDKAIEASSFLLGRKDTQMSRLRLVKLLYLADREFLRRFERPIVGGNYFSLPHGPVTSEVLDAINGKDHSHWQDHLDNEGNEVVLKKPVEPSLLSKAALDVLREVREAHASRSDMQLRDWTHQQLPEYSDPGKSRAPIEPDAILAAVGKSANDIDRIAREIAQEALEDHALGR